MAALVVALTAAAAGGLASLAGADEGIDVRVHISPRGFSSGPEPSPGQGVAPSFEAAPTPSGALSAPASSVAGTPGGGGADSAPGGPAGEVTLPLTGSAAAGLLAAAASLVGAGAVACRRRAAARRAALRGAGRIASSNAFQDT
jgi:hypothetical protein